MINKKIDEISAKLETIKVLVQDNEYLKNVEKICDEVNKRNQILENRINRAIEEIEQWEHIHGISECYDNECLKEDLLEILKGEE